MSNARILAIAYGIALEQGRSLRIEEEDVVRALNGVSSKRRISKDARKHAPFLQEPHLLPQGTLFYYLKGQSAIEDAGGPAIDDEAQRRLDEVQSLAFRFNESAESFVRAVRYWARNSSIEFPQGGSVVGDQKVDLSTLEVNRDWSLIEWSFHQEISLSNSRFAGKLILGHAKLNKLDAEGITVAGDIRLISSVGENLNFRNAHIGGDFYIRDGSAEALNLPVSAVSGNLYVGTFQAAKLNLNQCQVNGNLTLEDGSGKQLNLTASTVAGNLIIRAYEVRNCTNDDSPNLNLRRCRVGGYLIISDLLSLDRRANFSLMGSNIGADIEIKNVELHVASLLQCEVGKDLSIRGATITGGLDLTETKISGNLWLQSTKLPEQERNTDGVKPENEILVLRATIGQDVIVQNGVEAEEINFGGSHFWRLIIQPDEKQNIFDRVHLNYVTCGMSIQLVGIKPLSGELAIKANNIKTIELRVSSAGHGSSGQNVVSSIELNNAQADTIVINGLIVDKLDLSYAQIRNQCLISNSKQLIFDNGVIGKIQFQGLDTCNQVPPLRPLLDKSTRLGYRDRAATSLGLFFLLFVAVFHSHSLLSTWLWVYLAHILAGFLLWFGRCCKIPYFWKIVSLLLMLLSWCGVDNAPAWLDAPEYAEGSFGWLPLLVLAGLIIGYLSKVLRSFMQSEPPEPCPGEEGEYKWNRLWLEANFDDLVCLFRKNKPTEPPPAQVSMQAATIGVLDLIDLPHSLNIDNADITQWKVDSKEVAADNKKCRRFEGILERTHRFRSSNFVAMEEMLARQGDIESAERVHRHRRMLEKRNEPNGWRKVLKMLHSLIGYGTRKSRMFAVLFGWMVFSGFWFYTAAEDGFAVSTAAWADITQIASLKQEGCSAGTPCGQYLPDNLDIRAQFLKDWERQSERIDMSIRIENAALLAIRYHVPIIGADFVPYLTPKGESMILYTSLATYLNWILWPLFLTTLLPSVVHRRS
jgi:hypothetical protein